MSGSSSSSSGIGFFGLLGVLFIGLKLTGYIDWSWWWVLAPVWGPVALFLAIIVAIAPIALGVVYFRNRGKKKVW